MVTGNRPMAVWGEGLEVVVGEKRINSEGHS
jgi:hypothetical protein